MSAPARLLPAPPAAAPSTPLAPGEGAAARVVTTPDDVQGRFLAEVGGPVLGGPSGPGGGPPDVMRMPAARHGGQIVEAAPKA